MLRKIFLFIIIAGLLLSLIFLGITLNKTMCDKTLYYSIENLDSRFEVSFEDLESVLLQAESVWESAFGLNLFEYNQEAEFKINLTFDERQQFTLEEKSFREKLEISKTNQGSFTGEYNLLTEQYSAMAREYEIAFELYEKHLLQYNSVVNRWNTRGGAPPKVYEGLEKDRMILENEGELLEQKRLTLNSLATQINSKARENNQLVDEYNTDVLTYNNKFGMQREFDQGDYRGNEINIYQFDTLSDLRLTLAHEFGHAMGLSHVENSASIMYYLMDEQNLLDPKLTEKDTEALRAVCGF